MSATCETCRWWRSWANGETGECAFPVPIWLFYAGRAAGIYAPSRMDANTIGCTAHQPKEPDHG